MKKAFIKELLVVLLAQFSGSISAQVIYSNEVKFVHPILEKWVDEYKKEHSDFSIDLMVENTKEDNSSGLQIVANTIEEDKNTQVVYVGRYALLPVSNTQNPLLEKTKKGLKKKDLVNLLFEKDMLADDFDPDEEDDKYTATVYSRGNNASTAVTLAEYFEQSPERIKGKKILGDEIYLLAAVKKDTNGIAFNTLNYVFDLKSRRLKSDISLLPLNLKSKYREALESNNIDKLISLLETDKIETIPVENFGIAIPAGYAQNNQIKGFINWVLNEGQKFNHEFGFLTLGNKTHRDLAAR